MNLFENTYKTSKEHMPMQVCLLSQLQVMFSPSVENVEIYVHPLNSISQSLQAILRRAGCRNARSVHKLISDACQFHLEKAIN